MDLMGLREGASVKTADGENLGRIDRFIVDPSRSAVTDLVVQKGALFLDDRVVPVDHIDHVDEEGPVLAEHVSPDALPPFETTHYVEVDDATRSRLDSRLGTAAMWRFPVQSMGMYPMYPVYTDPVQPEPARVEVKQTELSESALVLDEDTVVIGIDGEKLGRVSEMVVDQEGRLSHLVVDLGMFSGNRVLPAHWIDSLREDQVTVAVGKEALRGLEPSNDR